MLVIPEDGSRWRLDRVTDGFLREDQRRAEWGYLSRLLHATNPYKQTPSRPRPDLAAVYNRLHALHGKLTVLLARHHMTLLDQNVILMGQMHAKDGRVHVQAAHRIDPV